MPVTFVGGGGGGEEADVAETPGAVALAYSAS